LGSSALKYTSASNATILSTASSVFSLIIGVMFKVETFTPGKVVSVLCSIAGILLITLSSASHEALSATTIKTSVISGEIYGDLLSTAGAFSYSCFLVLLRIKLGGQTDSKNDSLLYGYLGLTILVIGIPLLLVFDVLNWEELSLPEHMSTLVMMVLASLFNAISDLCGSKASLITSPLSVSLSLAVGIPISMILDAIFYGGMSITPRYLLGIICILVSFISNSLADEKKIVETAIENAIEEAIYHDESLSVLLTPKLRSTHSTDFEQYRIPDLSISAVMSEPIHQQRLVVTGGENHKYFFREIKD
jgi:solute carrier family 35 protein F5